MTVLGKRMIAFGIDALLFGSIVAFLLEITPTWFGVLGSVQYIIFITPFFLKDLAFRNASVGKKIMGIEILSRDFLHPKALVLVKRAVFTTTIVYYKFLRAIFIDKNYIELFDWESSELKTIVIEKEVLKQLRTDIKQINKDESIALRELYEQYLRSIYIK